MYHRDSNAKRSEEKSAADQQLLANIEEMKGDVPPPLEIMAMRPGTVSTFMAHRNQVMENGPLTERERSLIGIGIAVAMKSSKCVSNQANNARQAEVSEDEIVQAMLMASVMLGASPLHVAYSGVSGVRKEG